MLETADGSLPRKEKTKWKTCEVNLPPSTYVASPRDIQAETVPCKDALPQTTDGASPMKEQTGKKLQTVPRLEMNRQTKYNVSTAQTAYGSSSREEQTETMPN